MSITDSSRNQSSPELVYLNLTKPCTHSYPLRRSSKNEVSVQIEAFGDSLDKFDISISANYAQLLRESALHSKWTILSLSISVALFLHFVIQSEQDLNFKVLTILRKPLPVLFVSLTAAWVNTTMHNLILLLGSSFDVNDHQGYQLTKESNVFSLTYLEVLVMATLIFAIVTTLFGAFDIIVLLVKLLFGNSFIA